MDDGHGAVGHGIELVEAAGLEARGHEQHVAAGRDAVRQANVEPHPPAALLVPARLHLPARTLPHIQPLCTHTSAAALTFACTSFYRSERKVPRNVALRLVSDIECMLLMA